MWWKTMWGLHFWFSALAIRDSILRQNFGEFQSALHSKVSGFLSPIVGEILVLQYLWVALQWPRVTKVCVRKFPHFRFKCSIRDWFRDTCINLGSICQLQCSKATIEYLCLISAFLSCLLNIAHFPALFHFLLYLSSYLPRQNGVCKVYANVKQHHTISTACCVIVTIFMKADILEAKVFILFRFLDLRKTSLFYKTGETALSF